MKKPTRRQSGNRTSKDDDEMPGRAVSTRRARSFAIYGRSGTGKTTLAATFPTPILLLDLRDEGTDSISDVEGIECREIDDFDDFQEMFWWLKKNKGKFKTIVIDTVTQLGAMVLDALKKDKKGKKGDRRPGDWGTLSQRDWGDISAAMKEWLQNYRDLTQDGINIVFIAQEKTSNHDDDVTADSQLTPEVGPALSKSVASFLNAGVSVLAHTFIQEREEVTEVKGKKRRRVKIEYCLGLGPHPVYVQKVRKPKSSGVPGHIVDPSYEDILAIIKGE